MFLKNRKFGYLQQQNYTISSVIKRFFSSYELFFTHSAWYLVVGSDTGYTVFKKVTDHLDLEKQRSEWLIFYPSKWNTYPLMLQCSSTMFPTISPTLAPSHQPTSGKYERTGFSLTILFCLFEPTRPTTSPTAHPTIQGK